jgi:GT2 family glycosyltransferase
VRLSLCIVNWNTRDFLRDCLHSIEATRGDLDLETIVVDNASGDGSAEMVRESFPQVRLIANADNTGYAHANNQALAAADGAYRMLLNPDIVVHEGALQALVAFMDHEPGAGAVAPRLLNPDGTLQYSCRSFPDPDVVFYEALGLAQRFPHSRRFGKYRMTWWGYDELRPVPQPMASALLLRSAVLDRIGLMDEQFPIFFNDVDLCRRIWDAGYQIYLLPEATMTHFGGSATSQVRREMIAESHRAFLRYYEKHYRGKVNPLAYGIAVGLLRLGGWWRLRSRKADTEGTKNGNNTGASA